MTLTYAVCAVVIEMFIGTGLVYHLNLGPYVAFFRILIVLPLLLPPVIAALVWKVMFAENGVADWLLESTIARGLPWFDGPDSALFTVILVHVWLYTLFVVLLIQAASRSIPTQLREASDADGAGPLRSFFSITLTMSTPVLIVVITFRGIVSLTIFDVIYTTTKGGPITPRHGNTRTTTNKRRREPVWDRERHPRAMAGGLDLLPGARNP